MSLRIPSTVNDRSLLQDEPFRSRFAARALAQENRAMVRAFYSSLEKDMRETENGLDAAKAWIKTVFGAVAAIDSRNINAFTEWFWMLEQNEQPCTLDSFLTQQCKRRGLKSCSMATRPIINVEMEQEDYDAECEDNSVQPQDIVSPLPAVAPLGPSLRISSLPTFISVNHGAGRSNKRKAKKAEPLASSESSNSSAEEPLCTVDTYRCIGLDSLTPLPSDDENADGTDPPAPPVSTSQRATLGKKRSKKEKRHKLSTTLPLSGHSAPPLQLRCDSGPLAPSSGVDDHVEVSISSLKSASAPVRANPSRKAANRGQLTELMVKETQYFASSNSTTCEKAPSPKIARPSTAAGSSFSTNCTPADGRRDRTHRKSSRPESVSDSRVIAPTAQTPFTTLAISGAASASPPLKSKYTISAALRRKLFRKRRLAKKTATLPERPNKKLKGKDGTAGSLAQLFVCETATRTGGLTLRNKVTQSGVAVPGAGKLVRITKIPQKRTREQLEDGVAGACSAGSTQQQATRRIAPLPTSKRTHSQTSTLAAPAIPQDTLGHNARVIDCILQDAATDAMPTLDRSAEIASVWDDLGELVYPEAESSDEEIPSSSTIANSESTRCMELSAGANAQAESESRYLLEVCQAAVEAECPKCLLLHCSDTSSNPEQPTLPRLPLPQYPPIWAQSRQEVCESFNKFRSYQGGVYFRNNIAEGYLLSAFSACRDVFHNSGKLIISHGGGKAESLHKTAGHIEASEASDQQEADKSVRALLQTYRQQRPIVLLIDDKYALFPYDLAAKACTYAVLGWYHIAHAWAEYQPASNSQGRVIRYKFAFQWCEGQDEPWWTAFGSEPALSSCDQSSTVTDRSDTIYRSCLTCKSVSPQVYEQGWMCLKPDCQKFWTALCSQPVPGCLTYSSSFLKPVSGIAQIKDDLRPPPPVCADDFPNDGVTTSSVFCKGWHCRKCGRLSSRYKWEHWECRACGNTYSVSGRLRTAIEFRYQRNAKHFDRHQQSPSIICPKYQTFTCGRGFGQHILFILPRGRGNIHLLLAPPLEAMDADTILREYQEQAASGQLKFRRWPLRSHKCRGTLLTNYFSQNTGEPYQYVGGADNTVPWDTAPKAVTHALQLIKLRMQQARLSAGNFNEVLSAAYMEKQKMAFHSDSEKGLGPVVASLSLGASALMYFRLHTQYAESELGAGNSREVLKLFLRHGDVLVMEGEGIQTYYEHTVVPQNFRIAATARSIGSNHQ